MSEASGKKETPSSNVTEGRVVKFEKGSPTARIMIATIGTRGDVLPFIALAHGLLVRGHAVRIATSAKHEELITGAGIDYVHVRPDTSRRSHPEKQRGNMPTFERMLVELIAPGIAEGHADLVAACRDGACF